MATKWTLSKNEVKEALVKQLFGYPDDNLDWYDVRIDHSGNVTIELNTKGFYHYNNPKETIFYS